jgi:catalase (peroxidase I)
LHALMTESQPWWPADYGHCGKDAHEHFVRDFIAAWKKVMDLDRFDLA